MSDFVTVFEIIAVWFLLFLCILIVFFTVARYKIESKRSFEKVAKEAEELDLRISAVVDALYYFLFGPTFPESHRAPDEGKPLKDRMVYRLSEAFDRRLSGRLKDLNAARRATRRDIDRLITENHGGLKEDIQAILDYLDVEKKYIPKREGKTILQQREDRDDD